MRTVSLSILVSVVLLGSGAAAAAPTAEQKCEKGRYDAAARHNACQQKALGRYFGGADFSRYQTDSGKCAASYRAVWPKLQARASGTGVECDAARFVDNGDGTVTDRLTLLQWEKKTDDTGVHDRDNIYTWSLNQPNADGTVWTGIFAALNGGGCFAGHCDWRLPTVTELQTILLEPYPCTSTPCIDAIFGPDVEVSWSATFVRDSFDVWFVDNDGRVDSDQVTAAQNVRAVRGGL